VVAAAEASGLRVTNLDDYRAARAGSPALVLGYGNIATTEVPVAVRILASAIADSSGRGD
jgi:GntR family transcriptional regulator/MocR family aminotransferase